MLEFPSHFPWMYVCVYQLSRRSGSLGSGRKIASVKGRALCVCCLGTLLGSTAEKKKMPTLKTHYTTLRFSVSRQDVTIVCYVFSVQRKLGLTRIFYHNQLFIFEKKFATQKKKKKLSRLCSCSHLCRPITTPFIFRSRFRFVADTDWWSKWTSLGSFLTGNFDNTNWWQNGSFSRRSISKKAFLTASSWGKAAWIPFDTCFRTVPLEFRVSKEI